MKYFFGFAAVIVLVILTFVLIWRGFSGGGDAPAPPPPLHSYTFTTTAMRFTIDGPVDPESEHRALQVTVSRSESRIEILKGYDRVVSKAKSYASNQEAYETFLRALDLLDYTQGNDDPALADDRGYCPSGRRFIYEIVDGTDILQRYWSTSCSRKQGTFLGSASEVQKLFKTQIPDYDEFTRGLDIR